MTDLSALRPVRLWTSCRYEDHGRKVVAEGEGWMNLFERFTISANGVYVEMACITWTAWPKRWVGQDVESYMRERSMEPVEDFSNYEGGT